MEEILATPVMQYGALGAVVVFVVMFMRYQTQESEDEQVQRLRRDEFIEGLVTRAFASQDAHLAAWREMTTETMLGSPGFDVIEIVETWG